MNYSNSKARLGPPRKLSFIQTAMHLLGVATERRMFSLELCLLFLERVYRSVEIL